MGQGFLEGKKTASVRKRIGGDIEYPHDDRPLRQIKSLVVYG